MRLGKVHCRSRVFADDPQATSADGLREARDGDSLSSW